MELGPVFRALVHNRVRFWLITVEVALTLAEANPATRTVRFHYDGAADGLAGRPRQG